MKYLITQMYIGYSESKYCLHISLAHLLAKKLDKETPDR